MATDATRPEYDACLEVALSKGGPGKEDVPKRVLSVTTQRDGVATEGT